MQQQYQAAAAGMRARHEHDKFEMQRQWQAEHHQWQLFEQQRQCDEQRAEMERQQEHEQEMFEIQRQRQAEHQQWQLFEEQQRAEMEMQQAAIADYACPPGYNLDEDGEPYG